MLVMRAWVYASDASAWVPSYHFTETILRKLTDLSVFILLDVPIAQLTVLFLKYSLSQDSTLPWVSSPRWLVLPLPNPKCWFLQCSSNFGLSSPISLSEMSHTQHVQNKIIFSLKSASPAVFPLSVSQYHSLSSYSNQTASPPVRGFDSTFCRVTVT